MTIQFINTEDWGIEPKSFGVFIRRLKKHVPGAAGVLNVVFVNDSYIRSLNKRYRKKNKATDVLSFSYLDTPDFKETKLIGEIYISVEMAEKNVGATPAPGTTMEPALGTTMEPALRDELSKLFVHGFLHVFGYDHELDADYEKMYKVECEVLKRKLPFIKDVD